MPPSKPKLGQNFLTDFSARLRIVESLGDIGDRTVLEIGPGRGALTNLLVARARHLVAVELDSAMAPRLREQWVQAGHVRIVEADILALDLKTVLENPGEKMIVVGNLPYYITSDILLHLFSHSDLIDRAVLMVQEEVADRLSAQPGVREYGVLSATAQMHARVEKLFALPPDAFSPPPKVRSAVVRLDMRPRFEELQVERESFLHFLQICFRQKRKTLANNLKAAALGEIAEISRAMEAAGIDPSIRSEAVGLEKMASLYRHLNKLIHLAQVTGMT